MKNNAIEYLKDSLKVKTAQRERAEALEQDNKDRLRAIGDAPSVKEEDFWCERCQKDFTALGYRQLNWVMVIEGEKFWCEPPRVWRGWYEGECAKGHRARRSITDKQTDPYYYRSQWIKRQQVDNADDFLTPDDPRFRIKYPEAWARLKAQYGNPI